MKATVILAISLAIIGCASCKPLLGLDLGKVIDVDLDLPILDKLLGGHHHGHGGHGHGGHGGGHHGRDGHWGNWGGKGHDGHNHGSNEDCKDDHKISRRDINLDLEDLVDIDANVEAQWNM